MIVYAKRDWIDHPSDTFASGGKRKVRRPIPEGTKNLTDMGEDPASVLVWTPNKGIEVIAKGTFTECVKKARKIATKLSRDPLYKVKKVDNVE